MPTALQVYHTMACQRPCVHVFASLLAPGGFYSTNLEIKSVQCIALPGYLSASCVAFWAFFQQGCSGCCSCVLPCGCPSVGQQTCCLLPAVCCSICLSCCCLLLHPRSKADEVVDERDRQRVLIQITQNLATRIRNSHAFNLPTFYLPHEDDGGLPCNIPNAIEDVCAEIDKV